MPTNYSDQFFIMDPANPPSFWSSLTYVNYTLTDQNNDGDIDRFNNDSINSSDVTSSYPGDTVTVWIPGSGVVTYTGTTFYLADGQRVFTPTDGQVLENGRFINSSYTTTQGPLDVGDLGPPCFVAGTLIETERGLTPIEQIEVGDLVQTLDHGLQPVRWRGEKTVQALGDHAPIRFAAGAIGNARPLMVSPQHKILVSGWRAELFFGEPEVLVPAVHLANAETIHRAPRRFVSYHHLMFDAHEIVLAESVPSESFYPGAYILNDDALRREVEATFPEMIGKAGADWSLARPALTGKEAKMLQQENLRAA